VTYTLPIGNKAAKARHRIAELNREKGSVDVQNQEQTVRVEVRSAVREVESGVKRVAAARKNVELQEKKLEAEQKKFENGMSTSFEVLTFQNDLADAELSMIQAGLDYARSLIAFERSKGVLLESRGLTLAE
jgi:outer membrane protein TolC